MNENRDWYYSNIYRNLQRTGLQGWGNSLIDKLIEKSIKRSENMDIIELGASSGEHLTFVPKDPPWQKYICLDIAPGKSNPERYIELTEGNPPPFLNLSFVQANAEKIPFQDESFDLVLSTCLLAHVREPEQVLGEMRRVAKNNGQIVIGLPADPGILNRLVKFFITYPKMKRMGIQNPHLEYAREHINAIGNLIPLIKATFESDKLRLKFFPFRLHTWNFNLAIIIVCSVKK